MDPLTEFAVVTWFVAGCIGGLLGFFLSYFLHRPKRDKRGRFRK